VDQREYDPQMGRTGRRIALAIVGLAIALLIAPAAQGIGKSKPHAHIACASTGCTETSTDDLAGDGLGATMTDQIPADANQGSIQVAPTCAAARDSARAASPLAAGPGVGPWAHVACTSAALAAFGTELETVVDQVGPFDGLHQTQSRRVVGCVLLSLAAVDYKETRHPGSFYDDITVSGTGGQVAFLQVCLQLVAYLQAAEQEYGARDAAASTRCSRQQLAVVVAVSRAGGRYKARITGVPLVTNRPTAIAVSCRRSGASVKLTLTPRRHRTFKQAGTTSLAIGYVNRSKTPLADRTTFKIN
jgi:hypothetical protein